MLFWGATVKANLRKAQRRWDSPHVRCPMRYIRCENNSPVIYGSTPARRARRAQISPIFPRLAPLFAIFCARVADPREGRGDVAIPPTRGPPRRRGLGSLGWRRE